MHIEPFSFSLRIHNLVKVSHFNFAPYLCYFAPVKVYIYVVWCILNKTLPVPSVPPQSPRYSNSLDVALNNTFWKLLSIGTRGTEIWRMCLVSRSRSPAVIRHSWLICCDRGLESRRGNECLSLLGVLCRVGSGLCDGLITCLGESFRVCVCMCVCACLNVRNLLTSITRRPKPELSRFTTAWSEFSA